MSLSGGDFAKDTAANLLAAFGFYESILAIHHLAFEIENRVREKLGVVPRAGGAAGTAAVAAEAAATGTGH